MNADECYTKSMENLVTVLEEDIQDAVKRGEQSTGRSFDCKIPEVIIRRFTSQGFKVDQHAFNTMPWSQYGTSFYTLTISWNKGV